MKQPQSARATLHHASAVLLVLLALGVGTWTLAVDRDPVAAGDWQADSLLHEMVQRTRWGPPLRVTATPFRVFFNMEILHLAALRRGIPLERIYKPGTRGETDDERAATAEFVITSPKAREYAPELPWQRRIRETLEQPGSALGRFFEPVAFFPLPDGTQLTLWQRRAESAPADTEGGP